LRPETIVPQQHLLQLPLQINRENISKIREFRNANREFHPKFRWICKALLSGDVIQANPKKDETIQR
jgi:hypothetical protein